MDTEQIVRLRDLVSPLLVQAAMNHPDPEKSLFVLTWDSDSAVGYDILRLDRMGRLLQHEFDSVVDSMPMWETIWHQAMIYAYA
jgi:hypothetical protein